MNDFVPLKNPSVEGEKAHHVERDKPLSPPQFEQTHLPMNLESSAADKWNTRLGSEGGRNPFGVVDLFPTIPRVARSHVERGKPRNPGL